MKGKTLLSYSAICDVEVGKNVLLVCYKEAGPDKQCVSMFNPTPIQLDRIFNTRLVGFNSRGYDAHILYARHIGYNNYQLWELSQDMIVREQRSPFRDAEHVFEIDVFDYMIHYNLTLNTRLILSTTNIIRYKLPLLQRIIFYTR